MCHRDGERGFTLIEILVVLVIIAILTAIAFITFRGARTSTDANVVKTAGQTYSEVIDAFALDHAGRVPVLGSADWPSNAINAGPVKPSPDASGGITTYLGRTIPESVQGDQVDLSTSVAAGGTPPATGRLGIVRYVVGPVVAPATVPTSYRIEVWAVDKSRKLPTRMTCWLGSYAPSGGEVQRCA